MRRAGVRVMLCCCAGALLLTLEGCSNGGAPARFVVSEDEAAAADQGKGAAKTGAAAAKAKKEVAGAPFVLPTDAAGRLLAEVLPPARPPARLDSPVRPTPPQLPAPALAAPQAVLLPAPGEVHRLPVVTRKGINAPEFVQAETLDALPDAVVASLPQRPTFDPGRPARVETADVSIPPAMPPGATPLPDRVSLDDPTTAASTAAVLQAAVPNRTAPVPFARQTVPVPFEYRRSLSVVRLPAEGTAPVSESPRVPK